MDPRLDATGQAALVRSGEVSAQELVQGAIERVEALNGELNAVIHPLFEKALATEPAAGPFQGVPMVVKDLACHTAGDPYHEGMGFLKGIGWREQEDTWLARRFREAGFVFVGRTNTPELGILPTTEPEAYGATRNPWDPGHSPGGSSGGSGAAVAAGMVPIGHANDGGGSIRIPASSCGLVGLKPSRGRVSQAPDFGDVMSGLTAELVVSRSVRDTAAVLEWVSDPPPGEPYVAPARERSYEEELGADPGRLRVGLCTKPFGGGFDAHPECVEAAEATGRLLESLGTRRGAGLPRRARRRALHPAVPGALERRGGLEPAGTGPRRRAARSGPATWSSSPGRWPRWAARTTRASTCAPSSTRRRSRAGPPSGGPAAST